MTPECSITVLLVGNYANDRQESMQRFAKVLADQLPAYRVTVEVCDPKPVFGRLRPTAFGLGKWLGYIDKFLIFPWFLRRRIVCGMKKARLQGSRFLVHIIDHSNAHYTRHLLQTPHLVTCNDLLAVRSARGEVPQNVTRWSGRLLQTLILNGLNRADRLVCISEATRQEVLRLSTLRPSHVQRIYMGQNHPYRPVPASEARQQIAAKIAFTEEAFVLHVGGNQWYKNRVGVLAIYAALQKLLAEQNATCLPKLVMIGPEVTQEMKVLLDRDPSLQAQVIFLDSVSNDQLAAFYSTAELLLFPSLEEGFGWPIAEAQACGCRVVTTGKAPMTEVGGDSAIYLDPADLDGTQPGGAERAARVIAALLKEDAEVRQTRIARGLDNASRFSTAGMMQEYVKTYRVITHSLSLEVNLPRPTEVSVLV